MEPTILEVSKFLNTGTEAEVLVNWSNLDRYDAQHRKLVEVVVIRRAQELVDYNGSNVYRAFRSIGIPVRLSLNQKVAYAAVVACGLVTIGFLFVAHTIISTSPIWNR